MVRAIYDPHFGTSKVEFESDYPLTETIQRLQNATKGGRPAILGTVAETYVSIRRADPPVRRDFRPWFFGKFHEEDGRVVLRGRFSMHDGARIFMALWLAGCALALLRTTFSAVDGLAEPWLPLIPLAMMLAGSGGMWLGRRATQRDPEWISDVIWGALKIPH